MLKLINLNKVANRNIIFKNPGRYVVVFKNLSGKFSFDIKASDVTLEIYGLFVGKKNDLFKVETIQRHLAPNSKSNLLIKGVFYDQSKFIYQGLIRIEKEAQKSHAYQKNKNLIMSENSFVDSRPFLEILANDVYCTHGSTTGKLNPEDLFYLRTRGLSQTLAKNVLVNGFIKEIETIYEQS